MTLSKHSLRGAMAAASLAVSPAWAQDDSDLQKKLANPIADIVTLPFQWTTNFNAGPFEKPQYTLNIQPVYPVKIGGGWSLINRAIVPLLSNPALLPGQDRKDGLGDITYEGFFAPTPSAGGWIWGVGPAMVMRTATDERLGAGKWSLGPAVVGIKESGPWTVGALATQVWSVAGDDNRPNVSAFTFQPIVSYRLDSKQSLGYVGIVTADWEQTRSSQRWTVPLGVSYSLLVRPEGFVPMNFVVGAGYNVIRPDNASDWFVRFQVNFVLPK
ncbi:hypothetical protein [Variovorax saccharolyticus]|uniref:hypothetical protein n=1 Tax=Variovorax saccharolyticus TaxID=3053516 RepID=UPI0025765C99|nr:hypothetical protein [Variovorax sp. J22R187]MDM0017844.1 hypothetical protein [Variovorax sp. J22R187]